MKTKLFTRLTTLFLACVLAFGCLLAFAGCSKKDDAYDADNFLPNGTADNPYRIVKEPVTITIFAPHSAGNPEYADLTMFKYLSKVTGLNFKFVTPDTSAYNNQKASAWSTGDLPDLFLFNNSLAEQVQYAEKGYDAYVPFNDASYSYTVGGQRIDVGNLIDNFMPNYKAGLASNFGVDSSIQDAVKTATLNDGKMYVTVSVNDVARDLTYKMFINQEWIDNINKNYGGYNDKLLPNADEIRTIDEYLNVLRAFRDLDANGNGNPNDEIPVTAKSMEYLRNFILQSYGYVSSGPEITEDGFVYVPYTEAYRKYLQFANTLYKEGLLHKDTFSISTDNQMAQYGNQGRLGSFVAAAAYLVVGYDRESEYTTFGPLTSSYYTGTPIQYCTYYFKADGACIPTSTKYVREVARLIDIMYSDLGKQLIAYGVEGSDWTWDNDEHTSWTFHVPDNWEGNQEQYRATITPNVGSASALYWSNDFVGKMNDEIITSLNAMSERYRPYLKVAEPTEIRLNSEEYNEITTVKATLDPQLKYLESCFIRGEKDPTSDSDWNSFLQTLDGIGAQKLLKCYNDAYARYNSR